MDDRPLHSGHTKYSVQQQQQQRQQQQETASRQRSKTDQVDSKLSPSLSHHQQQRQQRHISLHLRQLGSSAISARPSSSAVATVTPQKARTDAGFTTSNNTTTTLAAAHVNAMQQRSWSKFPYRRHQPMYPSAMRRRREQQQQQQQPHQSASFSFSNAPQQPHQFPIQQQSSLDSASFTQQQQYQSQHQHQQQYQSQSVSGGATSNAMFTNAAADNASMHQPLHWNSAEASDMSTMGYPSQFPMNSGNVLATSTCDIPYPDSPPRFSDHDSNPLPSKSRRSSLGSSMSSSNSTRMAASALSAAVPMYQPSAAMPMPPPQHADATYNNVIHQMMSNNQQQQQQQQHQNQHQHPQPTMEQSNYANPFQASQYSSSLILSSQFAASQQQISSSTANAATAAAAPQHHATMNSMPMGNGMPGMSPPPPPFSSQQQQQKKPASKQERLNHLFQNGGYVETKPNKFIKLVGMNTIRALLEKPSKTAVTKVVSCQHCRKYYHVQRTSKALYCIVCQKLTPLTSELIALYKETATKQQHGKSDS